MRQRRAQPEKRNQIEFKEDPSLGYLYPDAGVTFTWADDRLLIEAENDQAMSSYNMTVTVPVTLTRERAAELRDWLDHALEAAP